MSRASAVLRSQPAGHEITQRDLAPRRLGRSWWTTRFARPIARRTAKAQSVVAWEGRGELAGPALLISDEAALHIADENLSLAQAGALYGVSERIVLVIDACSLPSCRADRGYFGGRPLTQGNRDRPCAAVCQRSGFAGPACAGESCAGVLFALLRFSEDAHATSLPARSVHCGAS